MSSAAKGGEVDDSDAYFECEIPRASETLSTSTSTENLVTTFISPYDDNGAATARETSNGEWRWDEESPDACGDVCSIICCDAERDPLAWRRLASNPWAATAMLCLGSLLPLADVVSDAILTVIWYDSTYFWISICIFAVATTASVCLGMAMDRNAKSGAYGSFFACGLFVSLAQLRFTATALLAINDVWGPSKEKRRNYHPVGGKPLLIHRVLDDGYSLYAYMAFFKLIEVYLEAIPQAMLQAFAFIADNRGGGRDSAPVGLLLFGLCTSLCTAASGLVGVYLSWEDVWVRLASTLFLLAMAIVRCCCYVVIVVNLGPIGVLFPAIGALLRAVVLRHFSIFGGSKKKEDLETTTTATPPASNVEDGAWGVDEASVGDSLRRKKKTTLVSGRLATAFTDVALAGPLLTLLLLVPFGVRVDDTVEKKFTPPNAARSHDPDIQDTKAEDEPKRDDDGAARRGLLSPRYEGIRKMYSFIGTARGTFRSRLASELAVFMIFLHAFEDLVMLLVGAILARSSGPSHAVELSYLLLYGLVPLSLAPIFYFVALRLVELRENRWQVCLGIRDRPFRSFWSALRTLPKEMSLDCRRLTGCNADDPSQESVLDVIELEEADDEEGNESEPREKKLSSSPQRQRITIEMSQIERQNSVEILFDELVEAALLEVVNRPNGWWGNVLVSHKRNVERSRRIEKRRKEVEEESSTKLVFLPKLLAYCCVNFRDVSRDFRSLDVAFSSLDFEFWTDGDLDRFRAISTLRGEVSSSRTVQRKDLQQLKDICYQAICDDDVRPCLRYALDELASELQCIILTREEAKQHCTPYELDT